MTRGANGWIYMADADAALLVAIDWAGLVRSWATALRILLLCSFFLSLYSVSEEENATREREKKKHKRDSQAQIQREVQPHQIDCQEVLVCVCAVFLFSSFPIAYIYRP